MTGRSSQAPFTPRGSLSPACSLSPASRGVDLGAVGGAVGRLRISGSAGRRHVRGQAANWRVSETAGCDVATATRSVTLPVPAGTQAQVSHASNQPFAPTAGADAGSPSNVAWHGSPSTSEPGKLGDLLHPTAVGFERASHRLALRKTRRARSPRGLAKQRQWTQGTSFRRTRNGARPSLRCRERR